MPSQPTLSIVLERLNAAPDDPAVSVQMFPLLRSYIEKAVRYHAQACAPPHAHDDIVQEVLVSLLKARPWTTTTDSTAFQALLNRVIHARTVDWVRSNHKEQHLRLAYRDGPGSRQQLGNLHVSELEFRQRYGAALANISASVADDELDRVILSHLAAGRNQKEVSELLEVSTATVSRRVDRMRRDWMGRQLPEPGQGKEC